MCSQNILNDLALHMAEIVDNVVLDKRYTKIADIFFLQSFLQAIGDYMLLVSQLQTKKIIT